MGMLFKRSKGVLPGTGNSQTQNTRFFLILSELMELFVAGRDQSAADQPNNLAEGYSQW